MSLPCTSPIRIRSIEPVALDMPLGRTVGTPIAPIRNVVSLFVAVRDEDGLEGWGEIWCNFPRFGLRHRARMVADVFAPALAQRSFASPEIAWSHMNAVSNPLRLQSGEDGPIAAVIAGIDIALWDIAGKRAGQPLWKLLGGHSPRVPVYASLGRADDPRPTIARSLDDGFRAFKFRSTGGIDQHVDVVRTARGLIGDACELMLDVNGTWEAEAAIATIAQLRDARLAWLEEPIPADAPEDVWRRLKQAAPMPLAGGENMLSAAMFDGALAARALDVLQPDVTKWGGFSGALPLARRVVANGVRLCPHSFAGAPGLVASAHVLAACNSPEGMLEYGVGHHPARDRLLVRALDKGAMVLGDAPGLGLDVDLTELVAYRIEL